MFRRDLALLVFFILLPVYLYSESAAVSLATRPVTILKTPESFRVHSLCNVGNQTWKNLGVATTNTTTTAREWNLSNLNTLKTLLSAYLANRTRNFSHASSRDLLPKLLYEVGSFKGGHDKDIITQKLAGENVLIIKRKVLKNMNQKQCSGGKEDSVCEGTSLKGSRNKCLNHTKFHLSYQSEPSVELQTFILHPMIVPLGNFVLHSQMSVANASKLTNSSPWLSALPENQNKRFSSSGRYTKLSTSRRLRDGIVHGKQHKKNRVGSSKMIRKRLHSSSKLHEEYSKNGRWNGMLQPVALQYTSNRQRKKIIHSDDDFSMGDIFQGNIHRRKHLLHDLHGGKSLSHLHFPKHNHSLEYLQGKVLSPQQSNHKNQTKAEHEEKERLFPRVKPQHPALAYQLYGRHPSQFSYGHSHASHILNKTSSLKSNMSNQTSETLVFQSPIPGEYRTFVPRPLNLDSLPQVIPLQQFAFESPSPSTRNQSVKSSTSTHYPVPLWNPLSPQLWVLQLPGETLHHRKRKCCCKDNKCKNKKENGG